MFSMDGFSRAESIADGLGFGIRIGKSADRCLSQCVGVYEQGSAQKAVKQYRLYV